MKENFEILIAEDDIQFATLMQIGIVPLGYRVIHVTNGQDAINSYLKNPYIKLIFMDNSMPNKGDGINATRQIRKLEQELKRNTSIVNISGNIDSKDIYNKNNIKIDYHLKKPFSLQKLREVVEIMYKEAS